MNLKLNPRIWFFLGFVSCVGMLSVGAYLQFVEELEPCPLCISQRLAIFTTGIIFLIAAIHNAGHKKYAIVAGVSALVGASISIRHIWLQHLPPDEVPECGPSLAYVFQNFPLTNTLKLMLTGAGDCAKVDWTMLGMSIPELTLLAFLYLAGLAFLQLSNNRQR